MADTASRHVEKRAQARVRGGAEGDGRLSRPLHADFFYELVLLRSGCWALFVAGSHWESRFAVGVSPVSRSSALPVVLTSMGAEPYAVPRPRLLVVPSDGHAQARLAVRFRPPVESVVS